MHKNLNRKARVVGSSNRIFGLVFALVFLLAGMFPLIHNYSPNISLVFLSLIFLILAIKFPSTLNFFNKWWTRFGLLLHRIVSPIALAIIFFGVVTLIGILMRIFRADPLRLKLDRKAESYWVDRSSIEGASRSMFNQF